VRRKLFCIFQNKRVRYKSRVESPRNQRGRVSTQTSIRGCLGPLAVGRLASKRPNLITWVMPNRAGYGACPQTLRVVRLDKSRGVLGISMPKSKAGHFRKCKMRKDRTELTKNPHSSLTFCLPSLCCARLSLPLLMNMSHFCPNNHAEVYPASLA
jgi:hypothetical protein